LASKFLGKLSMSLIEMLLFIEKRWYACDTNSKESTSGLYEHHQLPHYLCSPTQHVYHWQQLYIAGPGSWLACQAHLVARYEQGVRLGPGVRPQAII
jgi:hypothetical protein